MSQIAWLGTGHLGSAFVRALLGRGEAVRVWNRSPARAQALAGEGAVPCERPAEAARGAVRVHLVLSDDAAVDQVLEAAAPGLAAGALVIDHSTTSTAGARRRTAAWPGRGVSYLHAPVFMTPDQARAAAGLMLLSGERALVERARPLLAPMTGEVVDVGPRPDGAAALKLLGNLFLLAMTAGMADVLGLARAMGVAPAQAAALFSRFNPALSLPARFDKMVSARYAPPSWELAMARKDARLMEAEAEAGAVPLAVLPAIAARLDALLAEGLGELDWTVLARDHLPPEG